MFFFQYSLLTFNSFLSFPTTQISAYFSVLRILFKAHEKICTLENSGQSSQNEIEFNMTLKNVAKAGLEKTRVFYI
jgi:hypothetical protein